MNKFNHTANVYGYSKKLAREHYENFPVASFLFPANLRKDVSVIYTFARTADDIVDEGDISDESRTEMLNRFRDDFTSAIGGNYNAGYWNVLHQVIIKRKLNPQHFIDLLSAFEQDITKRRYETYNDVLDYCERSANPVGRLILQLYCLDNDKTVFYSDKICTALQITNFLQDVSIDIKKGRIYLPVEDWIQYNVNEDDFLKVPTPPNLVELIKHEVERTGKLFLGGEPILSYLPYRLKLQIGWTINGGRRILEKIGKFDYDVLNYRPTLSKIDYLFALLRSFIL